LRLAPFYPPCRGVTGGWGPLAGGFTGGWGVGAGQPLAEGPKTKVGVGRPPAEGQRRPILIGVKSFPHPRPLRVRQSFGSYLWARLQGFAIGPFYPPRRGVTGGWAPPLQGGYGGLGPPRRGVYGGLGGRRRPTPGRRPKNEGRRRPTPGRRPKKADFNRREKFSPPPSAEGPPRFWVLLVGEVAGVCDWPPFTPLAGGLRGVGPPFAGGLRGVRGQRRPTPGRRPKNEGRRRPTPGRRPKKADFNRREKESSLGLNAGDYVLNLAVRFNLFSHLVFDYVA